MGDTNDWEVELIGDLNDLRQLTWSFTGQNLQIIESEGKFYLKSSRFDEIDDAGEVRRVSKELTEMLSGGSILRLGTKAAIKVGGIYKLENRGRSVYVETNVISASARIFTAATVIRKDGSIEVSNPADPIKDWLFAAQENPAVVDVMKLLNVKEQDWSNLYRIYEIIEDDVAGPTEMARIGDVSKAELRRFKHTANSRKASGLKSRHPVETTDPPKNPMTLNDAKSMIFNIVETWLNTKK